MVKILIYSGCYGEIFKTLFNLYNISDVTFFEWYLPQKFDTNKAIDADLFICENISLKKYIETKIQYDGDNSGCSDNIIKEIKQLNPNITIIMFTLCNMHIFPFYHGLSFLKCKIIDDLLITKNKEEIIKMYNNDLINWKIKDTFEYSIKQLQIIEEIHNNNLNCDYFIKLSEFIILNYKKVDIFIDRVFPENIVINFLFNEIVNEIKKKYTSFLQNNNVDENLNLIQITQSPRYICHKYNKCLTQNMVDELNLEYLPTFNSKNIMGDNLEKYIDYKMS
jgi:hypothetical protein